MKTKTFLFAAVLLGVHLIGSRSNAEPVVDIRGAWQAISGDFHSNLQVTAICSEKYFSVAIYNATDKTFSGTHGGVYRIEGDEAVVTLEFHSEYPEHIGQENRLKISVNGSEMVTVDAAGSRVVWKRLDDGKPGKLAGAWLITGRYSNNQLSERTPGARRTMKILSGTRFQWIAYNVDTKEFFGTGGGTYTTRDGKYTENIEFFSRDNSRVGATLTFDFSIEKGRWRHKGLSSRGEPLDEAWTKREIIGL